MVGGRTYNRRKSAHAMTMMNFRPKLRAAALLLFLFYFCSHETILLPGVDGANEHNHNKNDGDLVDYDVDSQCQSDPFRSGQNQQQDMSSSASNEDLNLKVKPSLRTI